MRNTGRGAVNSGHVEEEWEVFIVAVLEAKMLLAAPAQCRCQRRVADRAGFGEIHGDKRLYR